MECGVGTESPQIKLNRNSFLIFYTHRHRRLLTQKRIFSPAYGNAWNAILFQLVYSFVIYRSVYFYQNALEIISPVEIANETSHYH